MQYHKVALLGQERARIAQMKLFTLLVLNWLAGVVMKIVSEVLPTFLAHTYTRKSELLVI
jgi:hypothetical protein